LFIKPRAGLKIHDPATKRIVPDTGMTVNTNILFWHRLARDEDVQIFESAPENEGAN
jgi:hypothetical protein